MRITKSIIKNLSWPTGATHLRVDCEGGKHAIADKKGAAVSFDGIDGELTFGAVVRDGKNQRFMPLANGKVDMEALVVKPAPVATAAKPAKPTAKEGGEPVAEQATATEPDSKPEVKKADKPREHTAAWKSDVAVMRALHNGNQTEANRLALEWYKGNASKAEWYIKWASGELEKLMAVIAK